VGVIAWIVLGIIAVTVAERFVNGRESHGNIVTCLISLRR
jgi:uncharacterized membrane protein YeaQ/YmgE (transglycosylase-associated protein family)